jgi:hypothetical protein
MGEGIPLFDPNDRQRALRRIRDLWKTGEVEWPDLAEDRREESGLDVADIWNTLKHGRIVKVETVIKLPRYTIKGKAVDGATVIFAVEMDGNSLVFVTLFEKLER